MRAVVALTCYLAACSFKPGEGPHGDGGSRIVDARVTDALDSTPDAAPDAPPDAMLQASTTDHVSVADTHLCETAPTTNFDGQTSTLVDGPGNVCVVAMRFDLSTIPAGATVTAAVLDIWTDFDPGGASTQYALAQSWVESEATWDSRSSGTAWTTAGAGPPSRGATAVSTLPANAANTEYMANISLATVQGWVTLPATNFGIAFVTSDADGTRWSTHENATAAHRPVLRVTHTP